MTRRRDYDGVPTTRRPRRLRAASAVPVTLACAALLLSRNGSLVSGQGPEITQNVDGFFPGSELEAFVTENIADGVNNVGEVIGGATENVSEAATNAVVDQAVGNFDSLTPEQIQEAASALGQDVTPEQIEAAQQAIANGDVSKEQVQEALANGGDPGDLIKEAEAAAAEANQSAGGQLDPEIVQTNVMEDQEGEGGGEENDTDLPADEGEQPDNMDADQDQDQGGFSEQVGGETNVVEQVNHEGGQGGGGDAMVENETDFPAEQQEPENMVEDKDQDQGGFSEPVEGETAFGGNFIDNIKGGIETWCEGMRNPEKKPDCYDELAWLRYDLRMDFLSVYYCSMDPQDLELTYTLCPGTYDTAESQRGGDMWGYGTLVLALPGSTLQCGGGADDECTLTSCFYDRDSDLMGPQVQVMSASDAAVHYGALSVAETILADLYQKDPQEADPFSDMALALGSVSDGRESFGMYLTGQAQEQGGGEDGMGVNMFGDLGGGVGEAFDALDPPVTVKGITFAGCEGGINVVCAARGRSDEDQPGSVPESTVNFVDCHWAGNTGLAGVWIENEAYQIPRGMLKRLVDDDRGDGGGEKDDTIMSIQPVDEENIVVEGEGGVEVAQVDEAPQDPQTGEDMGETKVDEAVAQEGIAELPPAEVQMEDEPLELEGGAEELNADSAIEENTAASELTGTIVEGQDEPGALDDMTMVGPEEESTTTMVHTANNLFFTPGGRRERRLRARHLQQETEITSFANTDERWGVTNGGFPRSLQSEFPHEVAIPGNPNLSFRYELVSVDIADSDVDVVNAISVEMVYQGLAWIGFAIAGPNGGMVGSEAIIGIPGGEPAKYFLGGYSVPAVTLMDPSQQTLIDATIEQDESSRETILTFTKLLVEPGELVINAEEGNAVPNKFLWAIGSGNELAYHGYNSKGSFDVALELPVEGTDQDGDDQGQNEEQGGDEDQQGGDQGQQGENGDPQLQQDEQQGQSQGEQKDDQGEAQGQQGESQGQSQGQEGVGEEDTPVDMGEAPMEGEQPMEGEAPAEGDGGGEPALEGDGGGEPAVEGDEGEEPAVEGDEVVEQPMEGDGNEAMEPQILGRGMIVNFEDCSFVDNYAAAALIVNTKGTAMFSNTEMYENEAETIVANQLGAYLSLGNMCLEENGFSGPSPVTSDPESSVDVGIPLFLNNINQAGWDDQNGACSKGVWVGSENQGNGTCVTDFGGENTFCSRKEVDVGTEIEDKVDAEPKDDKSASTGGSSAATICQRRSTSAILFALSPLLIGWFALF